MKNTFENILLLAIVASLGFTSCKKQKDDLDLGGSKGGEKTYDCPTLKKNFREECKTKKGEVGFVNADCECQTRNLESGDKKDKKDWDKKDKKDWDKKDKKDWDKKDKKDWDKEDERDSDERDGEEDEKDRDGDKEEKDNTRGG